MVVNSVHEAIQQLNRQGVTVLLVEQHAMKAIQTANRTFVLRTGKVVKEGDREEMLRDRSIVDAYLGAKRSATSAGETVADLDS